jgi:TPR repeat protein
LLSLQVIASAFDDAQVAAREGRYRDVVDILGAAIADGTMDDADLVVAYANRGIAYSLMGAYQLAEQDLVRAYELNPVHNLTLNHLGLLEEQVHQDYAKAREWYERAASAGFAASQVNLAHLYKDGKGVSRDYRKALGLYQSAADQQYSMAYTPLGRMYFEGLGASRNLTLALEWFAKGAQAGVMDAHYYLGIAHENGNGVVRDLAKAVEYYRIAAMQGHGRAQNSLGYLYRRGRGVEQDFLEAAKWYRLASDQGNIEALNRLAWLLATCPVDTVCNGEVAIELARQAVESDSSASHLDSLAAAYARVGRFDDAIAALERALSGMASSAPSYARYKRRLERYRQGIPTQL